jgi:reverse gyrase
MTLEELKKQLEEGKLTQEQFDEMVRILGLELNPDPDPEPQPEQDDIDKLIEKAVDLATNKLGNENKALREKLEKLKKTKLSAEEIAEEERREKETALAEREAAVKAAENRMFALKQIKKIGLDSGDETAIQIVDLVMGEDEDAISENVSALKKLVDSLVAVEVDKAFKSTGRVPGKGKSGGTQNNPFSKDTYNLTEQMRLLQENPELAEQLKMEAGVN